MGDTNINSPGRRVFCGAGLSLFFVLACEGKPMRASLNISLFNYLPRPIFNVKMNGTGFMGALGHSFYGSNAVMLMQPITLGPQIVTWRLDGPEGTPNNGDTVIAKNKPVLNEVPDGVKWLALHIYDDYTVEITLSKGSSEELQSQRGRKIIADWESKNDQ